MSGHLWLVADDYGLSPAVSAGILRLIGEGRLSGTGCMTLFPEWPKAAERLKQAKGVERASIGQHLTLTDFPGLTGFSLDGSGRMPGLRELISGQYRSQKHDAAIARELDAQLEAFVAAWGAPPAYLDGHQHIHFLRPVRRWLTARAERLRGPQGLPWLRGAPAIRHAGTPALKAKAGFVALLARNFDREMRAAGFPVKGPLTGFYDWRQPETFEAALDGWAKGLPEATLLMCHPGEIDGVLRERDSLVEARATEMHALLQREPLCLHEERP